MFFTIVQYLFIAIVFGIALWYVIGMFRSSFGSKKSCSGGCCSGPVVQKESKEQ
ncbi:MAG: FeoB-associated Cys-rich membrane protein [Moheibacter sp.]